MTARVVFNRYPVAQWNNAKREMKSALISAVKEPRLLSYKQVRNKIAAIPLEDEAFFPGSEAFSRMQGEVSTEEHKAGRGMLTAFMVNALTHMPGDGFFTLAQKLGYTSQNRLAIWSRMLAKVSDAWTKQHRKQ